VEYQLKKPTELMIGFSSVADLNFGKAIDPCQRILEINKPRSTL